MITILTYPEDQTTHYVIDWFQYNNKYFKIVNSSSFYNEQVVKLPSQQDAESDKNSFWFRKWRNPGISKEEREAYFMQLDSYYSQNQNCFWLNTPNDIHKGKGKQLQVASSCRLSIPETFITKNKEAIIQFYNKHDQCIIKYNEVQAKHGNNKAYLSYTQILTLEKLDQIELTAPCIVQEYIEKEVEIRTFYLCGKCYSMAIFSQNDEQTKIDFRKYNYERPNRNIPFKLPELIKNRVSEFMEKLNMN